jgi:hypothetical protein
MHQSAADQAGAPDQHTQSSRPAAGRVIFIHFHPLSWPLAGPGKIDFGSSPTLLRLPETVEAFYKIFKKGYFTGHAYFQTTRIARLAQGSG